MTNKTIKWKQTEQVKLLKQLSTLLSRGYPLLEALMILKLYLPSSKQVVLEERIEQMKNGETFHESLVLMSFHRDVLGYLYFAERHGDLSFALKEASQLLETKIKHYKSIIKILQYPLILIGITVGLILLINSYLLPQFSTVFESMNTEQNILLTFLLFLSKWIPRLIFFLLISTFITVFYFFLKLRKLSATKRWAYLQKIPFYGRFLKTFYSQYFAMQLSQLLKGGLSVHESLAVFESQTYFTFFKEEASLIKKELRSGESLASIILSRSYFEGELAKAISFGSINGELSRELYHYSKLSAEALEDEVNRKMTMIQPIVFIGIGLVVLTIYLAIMQPVFQMINEI